MALLREFLSELLLISSPQEPTTKVSWPLTLYCLEQPTLGCSNSRFGTARCPF